MQQNIANVITRLTKQNLESDNPYWNISYKTGIFLNSLIRLHGSRRVLEIGTSTGYSSLFIADALFTTNGILMTVESHEERFQMAKRHFQEANVNRIITQIKGHAPEILGSIEGNFDAIFLDATKQEHTDYWKHLAPCLEKNGIIITDNIISHKNELKGYLEFIKTQTDFQHSTIPIGTGLLLSLKMT